MFVLIGAAAERMAKVFAGQTDIHRADNMRDAVQLADRLSCPGGSVLLSPGCSSFDMYRNYEERGADFAAEFSALKQSGNCRNGN